VIPARNLAGQLEQALRSRAVIDHAIGIVMAESRCTAEDAFATLSRASNNRNMKLRYRDRHPRRRQTVRPGQLTRGSGPACRG